MEHRVDFTREEIPHVLHQAKLWLREIAGHGDHAGLEHLHQSRSAWSH